MSDLVGNPEDRFSRVEAHLIDDFFQEREERKNSLRSEIPEEPSTDHSDAIKIVLKLPHGSRIERRFLRTQSLKVS